MGPPLLLVITEQSYSILSSFQDLVQCLPVWLELLTTLLAQVKVNPRTDGYLFGFTSVSIHPLFVNLLSRKEMLLRQESRCIESL